MRDDADGRGISDDRAREIAKLLLREREAEPGDPAAGVSAQARQLPGADEDRVERALVELGAVHPDAITPAERDGSAR